jgi:hypothetical protein
MKTIKRIFLGLLIFLVVLVGVLAAVPYLFKDQLVAKTKTIINKNINAEVDFGTVNLSVFRHFPDLTLALNDFTIQGINDFQDIRLASAQEVAVTLDILSVLRKQPINIKNIDLNQPDIRVLVLSDGRANYNIAKPVAQETPADETSAPADFKIDLDRYTIKEGKLIYDDESLDTYVEATGIDHQGQGAFTSTVYDLNTYTNIAALAVNYGGIQYLNNAVTSLDAIFNIDQSTNTYTLKENLLSLNALKLRGDGAVRLQGNDIIMDLLIKAPSNDFKNLLSIIPGAYLEGYEAVKANGDFALDAKIKGTYSATNNRMPAIAANLKVNGANVQYPDLPLGISNIRAQASVSSPGSDLDELQIDISDFNLQIGQNPIGGRFQLTRPMSNPTIDTRIDGKLDLAELAQAFPMEGIEQLQGQIVADIEARTNMQEIDRGDYENVNMKGAVQASNLLYKSSVYPPIAVQNVNMDFSPRYVAVEQLDVKLGKSDLRGSGRIDNILAYFSPNSTMKGNVNLESDYFLVDEWMPSAATTPAEPTAGQLDTNSTTPAIFDRFDFTTDLSARQIDYDRYTINDIQVKGQFKPNEFDIQSTSAKIDESDLQMSGQIRNAFDYAFKNETLQGDIQVNSNYLNLNHFMELVNEAGETEEKPEASNEERMAGGIILVPANIKMSIAAKVKDLLYTNMEIKNLDGQLKVADQAVELREVQGETLGGQANFTGRYDTQDPAEPYFGMKLDLNRLRFQESFQTLNTFQQLAPIGQFLEGIFNTSLSLDGTLGKGMMPVLSTLNAKGFLETLNGTIKKYPPLEKLGEKLRIIELQDAINLENTRNWIEIVEGAVEVKPFDIEVDKIPLTIAGKHGLNMEMDYNIKAAIPRERLDNNALTNAIGESMGALQQKAQQLGFNLERSETVNLLIHLTGNLKDPKFGISMLGADGQTSVQDVVKQTAENEINKQKDRLEEAVEREKEKLEQKAEDVVDSAKTVLGQQVDSLKKKAGSKVDSLIRTRADSLLKDPARKVLDTLIKTKEIDQLKKELEEFNPFKKKKKSGSGGR